MKANWKWYGKAGHLIVGEDCRFHLCTKIGKYLISTVGEYFPDSQIREIFAESRGIKLEGVGDSRRNDYFKKIGYEEIGPERLYETMVFKVKGFCKCGCGMPQIIPDELDYKAYNDGIAATKGHMVICKKWDLK